MTLNTSVTTVSDGITAVTPATFAPSFLAALGLPTSQPWQDVINTWTSSEGGFDPAKSGGAAANNPLNTNCDWSGQIGCHTLSNGAQVGVYANLAAAVQSYTYGLEHYSSGYQPIVNAKSPLDLAKAIVSSPWAGSHYAGNTAWSNYFAGQGTTGPGATGGNTGSLPQGTDTSAQTGTGNPITDALSGVFQQLFGGFLNSIGATAGDAVLNILAIMFGIALVIFGLHALVRPNNSMTEDMMKALSLGAAGAGGIGAAAGATAAAPVEAAGGVSAATPEADVPAASAIVGPGQATEQSPETPRPTDISSARRRRRSRANRVDSDLYSMSFTQGAAEA